MRLGKLAAALVLMGSLGVGAAGFSQPAYAVGGIGNLFESLKAKQNHSAPSAQEEPDSLSNAAVSNDADSNDADSNDAASPEETTASANRAQESKVSTDYSYDLALLPHIGSFVLYLRLAANTPFVRAGIRPRIFFIKPHLSTHKVV